MFTFPLRGPFLINLIIGFDALILPGDLGAGVMRWRKRSRPMGESAEVLAALVFLMIVNSSVILTFGVIALMGAILEAHEVLIAPSVQLFLDDGQEENANREG